MHEPRLVFLDEPTTGLDPQSRANLWQHIRSLRDDTGVTVVLTTHYLDEADALADRVLVMDDGQIVADDTPDALKARISGDVVTLELADPDERARAEGVVRGSRRRARGRRHRRRAAGHRRRRRHRGRPAAARARRGRR